MEKCVFAWKGYLYFITSSQIAGAVSYLKMMCICCFHLDNIAELALKKYSKFFIKKMMKYG